MIDSEYLSYEKITVEVKRHTYIEPHNHAFLEMVYVTKGPVIHILNGKKMLVEKGDYFIVDYGVVHEYRPVENAEFEIINTIFKPEIVDKSLVNNLTFQDLINNYLIRFRYQALADVPTSVVYHDDDLKIYTLIEKLHQEFERKSPGYIEIMRSYLIVVIIETMRKINKEDTNVLYKDYIKYIISYIEDNYMEPITLTEISTKLNYSLPYLCAMFRKEVGASFHEYLQKRRIEQSCRLIANTDKLFSEIAELVGYTDVKSFNRIFKRNLKMTPREFKKLSR